jgi:phosphoribosylformylglycinamidine synthase subunit PurQ / glutaminase
LKLEPEGARPRACVLKADGTNCEVETAFGLNLAGAAAEIVPMNLLRSGERRLADYDLLVIPGGFSYGDDVVAGKIMAVELSTFLEGDLRAFRDAHKPIVGICNGFQVLVRTGLLPFGDLGNVTATLAQNRSGHFECRWVRLRVEGSSASAAGLPQTIELPVANGEGRFYASDETLAMIEEAGLVAFRYADESGRATQRFPDNPNGAEHAIAGIVDPTGRIMGLMPHPERFLFRHQHPAHRDWPADRDPDGLAVLRAIVTMAAQRELQPA